MVLVGKSEGKKPLVRPRRRWECMDMLAMEVEGCCERGNEHSRFIKCRDFLD
jgi:hypothetical protein